MAAVTAVLPFKVAEEQEPAFWARYAAGAWEPATLAVIRELTGPGRRFIDIGAWIGPTALAAAAGGAAVVAFEPDPLAAAAFRANLALNPELAERVTLVEAALWTEAGRLTLHARSLGDSESTVFAAVERKGERRALTGRTQVDALDAQAAFEAFGFGEAGLVKIDVEGAEYALLPHLAPLLAKARPPLLLALHPGHPGAGFAEEAERRRVREKATEALVEALAPYRPHRRDANSFVPTTTDELRDTARGTWLFQP
jgi:FkbM family methyltransferase